MFLLEIPLFFFFWCKICSFLGLHLVLRYMKRTVRKKWEDHLSWHLGIRLVASLRSDYSIFQNLKETVSHKKSGSLPVHH